LSQWRQVKAILLDILAGLSVAIAGILALGFLGGWRISVLYSSTSAAGTFQGSEWGVDRGRVVSYWAAGLGPRPPMFSGYGLTFRHWIHVLPPRPLDRRRSVWEFDAHFMSRSAGPPTFILACPIWCAMVPFLIAPALWLRKRRRKREIPRGFAVEQAEPALTH
jgi:hypothetical protein